MLRVIVLASALAHGKAAPSTSRNLAGRELGNLENCEGDYFNENKCYKGATADILSKPRWHADSICKREDFTCGGCLECWRPKDVCEPRAKDEHGRVFSSMTLFPYYDKSLHHEDGEAEGPCCDWCDNDEHAHKSWKWDHNIHETDHPADFLGEGRN